MGMDVFNMEISQEFQAFCDNDQFTEQIERRRAIIEQQDRPLEDIIILDLDTMIENRKLIIPIAWNLVVYECQINKNQGEHMMSFHRIKNKKKMNKLIKIDGNAMDSFSLQRVINIIFEQQKTNIKLMDTDKQKEILDKMEAVLNVVESENEKEEL